MTTEPVPMDLGRLRVLAGMRIFWAFMWLTMIAARQPATRIGQRAESLWTPLSLARWFDTPPSDAYIAFVQAVALVATVCVLVGLFTRAASALCLVSGILFLALGMSWGKVGHTTQAVLLVLIVLGMSEWGACLSVDAAIRRVRGRTLTAPATTWPDWPIWMGTFVLALLYVNSGLHKLVNGHFLDDGFGSFLRYRLALWSQGGSVPEWTQDAVRWVVTHQVIVDLMAYGSVLFEIGFVLALVSPRLRLIFLASAFVFHGAIGVFAGVFFPQPMMMALLLLVPTVVMRVRDGGEWLRGVLPTAPVEVREARWPVWARFGVATLASAMAILLVAPMIPASFPIHGARRVALWLTFSAPEVLIPLTPEVFAGLAISGAAAVAGLTVWAVRDMFTGPDRRWARLLIEPK